MGVGKPRQKRVHAQFCAERSELLGHMSDAANRYANAVGELASRIGILSEPEYRQICDQAEILRIEAEQAREVYRKHRDRHGC
jgi:hypothetical protein